MRSVESNAVMRAVSLPRTARLIHKKSRWFVPQPQKGFRGSEAVNSAFATS
jgi:hypothetical protein